MSRINTEQRSYLEQEFGHRVSFRKTERKLYGHDIAALPGMIKPLVGNTTPGCGSPAYFEEELVKLVHWAAQQNTPADTARQGYHRLRRRAAGQTGPGGRLLPDERNREYRHRKP